MKQAFGLICKVIMQDFQKYLPASADDLEPIEDDPLLDTVTVRRNRT